MLPGKKILIFIDWFLPGYKAGGPIQSVKNLVEALNINYDFWIVTSDRDLGETTSYEGITLNCWIHKGNYHIIYLDPKHRNVKKYHRIFNEQKFEIVYFNSFFSVPFTLKPLLIARKYVEKIILAPRGMLGKGALKFKPVRKKTFIFFAKIIGLYRKITWQATAENEKEEIQYHFGSRAQIKIIPNLPSVLMEQNLKRIKLPNSLNLFFLSRISPKKNLEKAIQFLPLIKRLSSIELHIVGPIDDVHYWNECKNEIDTMPEHIKIIYHGAMPNQELVNLAKDFHFFILPTKHENYGHVIIESLQYGCPLIISDQTPWRGLEEKGIGWDLPLDNSERWIEVLEYCCQMKQEEYDRMSQAAFEYANKIVNDPSVLEANRNLFS